MVVLKLSYLCLVQHVAWSWRARASIFFRGQICGKKAYSPRIGHRAASKSVSVVAIQPLASGLRPKESSAARARFGLPFPTKSMTWESMHRFPSSLLSSAEHGRLRWCDGSRLQ